MRVYRVRGDVNNYQALLADDKDIWRTPQLRLDGVPRQEGWVPPNVYSDQPRLKSPDIWTLVGCSGLIFTPDAEMLEHLEVILGIAGELLPLPYQDETFLLLNILQVINCLDQDRTRWVGEDQGLRAAPKKYEFVADRIPESTLFKIPETTRLKCCVWKASWIRRRSSRPSSRTLAGRGFGFSFFGIPVRSHSETRAAHRSVNSTRDQPRCPLPTVPLVATAWLGPGRPPLR